MNIVEYIEEISPDRRFAPFPKRLLHRPVQVKEPRPSQRITGRTSESARCIECEGSRVEVFGDQISPRTIAVQNWITHEIGSILANSAERAILTGDDSEGRSATPGKGSGRLPAAGDCPQKPRHAV